MGEIVITDLSNRVLEEMRKRGLSETSVRDFERYGIRPILSHFHENGWAAYSREEAERLVWRERVKVESGILPKYQWGNLRRAAVFLEQIATLGRIEEPRLRKWEATYNVLFQEASRDPEKADEIVTLVLLTRDEVLKLDLGKRAAHNYLYCGFGTILKYFAEKGESAYSQETLDACMERALEKFRKGELNRSMFQNIRKTALWMEEYRNTGKITHRKLSNVSFAYVNSSYERLIQEYREHMDSAGYLKESSRRAYAWSVRRFFRKLEELEHSKYEELQLADIVECIGQIAKETQCAVFGMLQAMRSFTRFVAEKHPELPDITPALTCVPLKRRRVYEGYTEEESRKILASIERESVKGKRNYAMIMVAYSTGLRGIDIVNLKFDSIDWRRREFRIVQEKTGTAMALPFETDTGNAIADYILNARPDCKSDYVFIRLQRPYTKLSGMWGVVADYARAVLGKSKKMHGPHGFRRGMGQRLTEAGVPASMVCDVMGHSSTKAILQYTSASVESLRRCSGTLEAIPVEQEALL